MKIRKTLFTTEIEVTSDEIQDSYDTFHPNNPLFELIYKFLLKIL